VLPQRLLRELEAYWRMYHPQGGWLFPSTRNPQEPLPDGTGQKIFYYAVRRAGLPDKGGIHCLRHSFATHWMEAGLPLFVLKRLLANCGRQQRLERARAWLGPGQPTAPAPAPTPRTLPVCPHCGWAALFLVRVVPPQRFQSPPARADSS
jgi:hypothetical protein